MVTLSRFTELRDRSCTEIFTFIVPKTILSDYVSDVQSKDFFYGYQRWFIQFIKTEYHFCGSLHIRANASPNAITCILDFTFMLHNREHFSRNEVYHAKDAVFTSASPMHASPNFVGLADLLSRQFTDEQGEFVIDVVLKNARSFYEDTIQVPPRVKGRPLERLESSYFAFGNLEWNLVLLPTPLGTMLKLNRMTHFEHNCQSKFRVAIGGGGTDGKNRFVSSVLENLSDLSGTGASIMLNVALENFVEGNTLKVLVEMFSANLLSEILVPGLHQSVHFHDRDKQGWHLQTYACEKGSTEFVKLKMFYDDVKHIPRDNARYVAWKVHLRPANSPPATKYEVLGPFAKYYQQRDVDFSFEITTKTPLSQEDNSIKARRPSDSENGITASSENSFAVLVEWLGLHLLYPSHYHHYDDFHRMQYHQMRLELATVQKESYSLERTLLQYQHGIKPQYHPADQDTKRDGDLPNGNI